MIILKIIFWLDLNFIYILFPRLCSKDSVDKQAVKGKIVLCEGFVSASDVGFFSGAVGIIFGDTYPQDSPFIFALPTTLLSLWNFREIQYYMKSTRYFYGLLLLYYQYIDN